MTKKYKFLVLTDHSKHSGENSVYALMSKLSQHPNCERVDIASRGNHSNDAFFEEQETEKVYAISVTKDFTFDETGRQFSENGKIVAIRDYDVIILRLPRPVSSDFMGFIGYLGENKVIINHPDGIEKTSTKAFLLNFPEICPPMKLCKSIDEIIAFSNRFTIVLKPLKEYGGKGLLKINGDILNDGNSDFDTTDYLRKQKEYIETEGYLAMKFLKNVSEGDKRILVVNGQILASSLRLPAKDSWLCNVAQGGRSVPSEVTPEELQIIKRITPKLLKAGILIYGADTLVDDNGKRILSEINTLSIGGFPQAEKQTGKPILQQTVDEIMKYVTRVSVV
ncbi:MAG: RimK family alpha-L-glutamate ligase [Saprospiraceae bacterium]